MFKLEGFDKDGALIVKDCVTHNYSDLPMKGLGKSMEEIGINEPVIIPQSAALDTIIWDYTKAEVERRAYELKAEIYWREIPPREVGGERIFEMWFSNGLPDPKTYENDTWISRQGVVYYKHTFVTEYYETKFFTEKPKLEIKKHWSNKQMLPPNATLNDL